MAARFSIDPPVEPMLAKPIPALPGSATGLAFEPKWDGFRALLYRRGDDVVIQGRMRASDARATGSWDLSYAFPEMVQRVQQCAERDFVLDGELVVIRDGRLAFDALQGRLRPRKEAGGWKIAELAHDYPTAFVAFDVLARGGQDLRPVASAQRREDLIEILAGESPPLFLSPQTTDLAVAARWFAELPGAGLDGLIVRPLAAPYTPGRRSLAKVKPRHTLDAVCAGWRPYAKAGPEGQPVVGSVLLGLYDAGGVLQMVGAMSAFPMATRIALAERFAALAPQDEADHPWHDPQGRAPGMPSRWSAGRSPRWNPLRPELVAEVSYDRAEAGRLRHLATFVRWRADRDPASCTSDQLAIPEPLDLATVLRPS